MMNLKSVFAKAVKRGSVLADTEASVEEADDVSVTAIVRALDSAFELTEVPEELDSTDTEARPRDES